MGVGLVEGGCGLSAAVQDLFVERFLLERWLVRYRRLAELLVKLLVAALETLFSKVDYAVYWRHDNVLESRTVQKNCHVLP